MNYIIQDKQQYLKIQARFQERSRTKLATSLDHVFYNVVRGKPLDRGFTPITNQNKLNSNCHNDPMRAFHNAKSELAYGAKPSKYSTSTVRQTYGEFVTEEQWAQIAEVANAR